LQTIASDIVERRTAEEMITVIDDGALLLVRLDFIFLFNILIYNYIYAFFDFLI
jgi:transcriptional antiterminator Rof (Rho-off)